ncbi:hypothetical protein [Microbacterium sp. H1-D42]|uniref:hypothetical protein n=1 Tax=Microbacterium sp. H1-D42 TaxID=2925844 RepID=UPI001F530BF1|nr:hypothetical protein [Microbacterium sp. H1-D42]UNK70380.1 hypothetical protein MNR00_14635 [Microbacterium sp. H1-D42]
MSPSRLRALPTAIALAAVALLATGCASSPASPAPTSGADSAPASHDHADVMPDHLDAAWLDDGRAIGIVTWGSSTPACRPAQVDATADGQTITVTLTGSPEASKGCDADLGPRADMIGVPEGVDVTKDVAVKVEGGTASETLRLSALEERPDGTGAQGASAGWFGDDGIVLLTWGSSSCVPEVGDVRMSDAGATVTLGTTTDMCTMDYAPRVTPILLPEPADRGAPFELTLVGGNLDGTVAVIG